MLELPEQEREVLRFVQDHVDSYLGLHLLRFWSKHPNAKFDFGALTCALNGTQRNDLQQALIALHRKGVVETCYRNGATFYSLTTEPQKRVPILRLSALGWHGQQRWAHLS